MKILVTGGAGFIGASLTQALLAKGCCVIGLDNLCDYYDVNLKTARLNLFLDHPHYTFHKLDFTDSQALSDLFVSSAFDVVIHLGAQAGVRYSIENPKAYIDSNLVGFSNVLQVCQQFKIKHFIYASSSSVYGANQSLPYREQDGVNHPVSLYAATKRSNELMAHVYAHIYGLPCTGLRFFTVYGPWGRPDMALFKFTKSILAGKPIDVYNFGKMKRDFTYIDDVTAAIARIIEQPAKPNLNWDPMCPDAASSLAPYRIYNIGNSQPASLMEYIQAIENALGMHTQKRMLPMQAGEVLETYADTQLLTQDFAYHPDTTIESGVKAFVNWYRDYYSI